MGATASDVPARGDRLDRFREIAATRLSAAQVAGGEASAEAYRDAWALLDDEIVENLATGGLFASPAFLQDRLDAFAEAWGAAALHLAPVGPLVVGAFALGDGPSVAATVRVYGGRRDEAALLAVFERAGRARVAALSGGTTGAFVVVWEGAPSGRGTRPLRLDLVRREADRVRVVWSTADAFADGLQARAVSVRGDEVHVRHELRYPGWAPGCSRQTEAEDVFRLAPDGRSLVRTTARYHDAWHRELHAAAASLFAALGAADGASLARLVPDPALRARLPRGLEAEPACDAVEGDGPDAVVVAATASGAAANRVPWNLTFQRGEGGWRLAGASPVRP